ncbi:helix-turn-helix domain-containing protein [Streptomyces sp. NPDC005047]
MTDPGLPAFPQLGAEERAALTDLARQQSAGLRLRGRIVLACAEGLTNAEVAQRLTVSPATVAKWRGRYLRRGVAGLHDAPRTGAGDQTVVTTWS